jgi:stage II sporulation protein AA (anti-sigma F factor antagonist)
MFSFEQKRGTLTVRLTGELDHRMASGVSARIDALLEESGARRLVFDLSGLDFMDSSGIGLIIGRYKRIARRGGHVAISDPDKRMDKIFQMSGIYQLVERLAQ